MTLSVRGRLGIAIVFALAVWMSTCMRPAYAQLSAPGISANLAVAQATKEK